MNEPFTKPFTKAEMEAMRKATRDEEGLKRRFWDKFKRAEDRIDAPGGRFNSRVTRAR